MRIDFLDIDRYLIEGHQAYRGDRPPDPFRDIGIGLTILGGFAYHWRKLLAVLVAVLVLGGVAANATSPTQPQNATLGATASLQASMTAAWQPADECRRISRPVSAGTMRWCAKFAYYLHLTGDWQPGDLTKLLRTADCESRGNPLADNPRSSAFGIGQFLDSTWQRWAPRSAAFFGYDNPNRRMAYDQIATMVLLYVRAGPGPWPNCGRR